MPAFNAAAHISEALDRILQQSFGDFELIISDNGSTDGTEGICRQYASQDSRIKYIRQKTNCGPAANFKFVLDAACGQYFMWAACDDIHSNDFVAVNLSFLEENDAYVASVSSVRFATSGFNAAVMGDLALTGNVEERFLSMLSCWHANSRFYSLFRTDALRACPIIGEQYLGADWAIILFLATKGMFNRNHQGFLIRGEGGASQRRDVFRFNRTRLIEFILPFYRLSLCILTLSQGFLLQDRLRIMFRMLSLNGSAFRTQIKYALLDMMDVSRTSLKSSQKV
ncbi:MAG: glycosyltransferase family 2 protein [Deltaproteobacteria bacterium]|nr:glycosyltransferase family 2 protein [Deltaproteobacteria bacterium]